MASWRRKKGGKTLLEKN